MREHLIGFIKALQEYLKENELREALYLHPGAMSPTYPGISFGYQDTSIDDEVILWRKDGEAPNLPVEEAVDEFLKLLGIKG